MNDALDYTKTFPAKPYPLTLEEAAWITPPVQITDTEKMMDVPRMRAYRCNRIREQLRRENVGAVILTTPLSMRYAVGVRNCALFQTHIPVGYLFVPAEGPVILFDSDPGRETGRQLEVITEVRDDLIPISHMFGGNRMEEQMTRWSAQMADLVRTHCGGEKRVAVEIPNSFAIAALQARGIDLVDAAGIMAQARKIKSPEEILAMNLAIAVAEDGMTRMRRELRNGIREQQLWSLMWQALIEGGGEWIDYRLMSTGDRSNPWQQEVSSRMIRADDLLVFDCGVIGPFAYGADISRAFHSGPGKPSAQQKKLYTLAWEEITHNKTLMRAGASFREIIEARYQQPEGFGEQLYTCIAHGLGMGDEWPSLLHATDDPDHYDGELEAGMVICVESYVGEAGGVEGVKLEDQCLVTDSGLITLSRYPFEENLLAREV